MSFWKHVNKVIQKADILLLVLDARLIEETRNQELESKIYSSNKPIIRVLNKCDLISKEKAQRLKKQIISSVFVSSTEFLGTTKLKEKIMITASQNDIKKPIKVGVVGYPNVGKSSLINALKGKSSAGVSASSGYTKGAQDIRINKNIVLIDTPGVIPYKEKNLYKHGITSTVDYSKVKDPDMIIYELMEKKPDLFEPLDVSDPQKALEEIAVKYNFLQKGAKPDIQRASRKILKELQKGNVAIGE